MAYPDVPCTIPGDGKYDSGRYGSYGKKPVRPVDGDSIQRSDPDLPPFVLKEGIDWSFRQSILGNLPNGVSRLRAESGGKSAEQRISAAATQASLAINRCLSFIPSVQAIGRAEPHTAIPRGQNGGNALAGQTLLD
jgi:hypothetical protein